MNNLSKAMDDVYYGETYIGHIYSIVKLEASDMDAIYSDYIKRLVGVFGFNALLDCKLLESCGIVNGRHLYVLCDK
jgi:hypothetical protein